MGLTSALAVGRDCSRAARVWTVLCVVAVLGATLATGAARASAAPGVAWALESLAQPTSFQPSDSDDSYTVSPSNVGGQDSAGTITLVDTLPAGVTTSGTPEIKGELARSGGGSESEGFPWWQCTQGAGNSVVTCTSAPGVSVRALTPAHAIAIRVKVAPGTPAGTLGENVVRVSGGGAPECGGAGQPACASVSSTTLVGAQEPAFDLLDLSAGPLDAAGATDVQAGDHPSGFTTSFAYPTASRAAESTMANILPLPVERVRRVVVDLPPGIVGDTQATPLCPLNVLWSFGACPPGTQVGVVHVFKSPEGVNTLAVYNLVPEHGYPAEFGIFEQLTGVPVVLYASIRPGPDYGVRITSQRLPEVIEQTGASTTFWGNPAAKDHSPLSPLAFFSNSSRCSGEPGSVVVHVDSWEHPGREVNGEPDFSDPNWKGHAVSVPPVEGCGALHFDPSIGVLPESAQAGVPSGYTFDVGIPQFEEPLGMATPPLKRATVALPAGVVVSPSAADGLQACSDAQFDVGSNGPAGCPLASQVATVTARTPVLAEPVVGQVFVGSPDCGPCTTGDAQEGRLLRLFLQVQIPGASLKFPGTVSVDPATGRLTATFAGLIQQPVSDIQLQFKGGPRAPLANPRGCGVFTTTSELEPWSAPFTGNGTPSSAFETTGCGNPGMFAPSFVAGTTSPQAGAFSPFSVSFSRTDGDQELGGVTVTPPPGLLGILKGVERCPEPQASQGACAAGSLIGHVSANAGPGSHPFTVTGGQVFLTGPYKGAPFGLSIVVPAVAGPFNLGNVIVRAAINVDPHSAQITVASDPLPRMLDGVPLQTKSVNVSIDRAGFTFNPTSCDPLSVGGTLTAAQGATAQVSSRFQAGGCAALGFHPSFTVSTQAKTSKKNGASLDVKVGSGAGQANIGKVAVTLPKQLPSRLTTIQQACPEAVFNANPASCPAGSNIGTATANTPVFANPLVGPAYLVSHGGAAFPDLVIILQGEGVTLDLVGSIDIKKGVTSSAFNSVPDAPISSFELNLPEGPHSGLAAVVPAKAKGNLCGTSLTMPTTITGQNGAQVKQNTKIAVSGCPKVKKKATRGAHGKSKKAKK
ncbi:MAG TPA: hypothetical protein VGY76_09825 [Solirubrobacteraceae bacterium]|jgi:hypothetical protein|nr:hypothetical protein [Solirubrobacteraceae bacterium]